MAPRPLRYASRAFIVVAFVCVALSFRTGSVALGIAAAVALVVAVLAGAAAVRSAPRGAQERAAARTALFVAVAVLVLAGLYFLIGLQNLGD